MKTLCAVFLTLVLSGCATTSLVREQPSVVKAQSVSPQPEVLRNLHRPMIYQFILSEGGELTEVYRDENSTVYGPPTDSAYGFARPPVITSARVNPRYQAD